MPDRKQEHPALTWNPKNVFSGTAWFYSRYRPGYPSEVFQLLREKFSLDSTSRVIDLGCGTGQVALPLASYVAEVIAIDPQEEMLSEGRQLAEERGLSNIRWVLGASGDLPGIAKSLGTIRLTTIARAFHWMDKEQTLADLFGITQYDGGVAIIGDTSLRDDAKLTWKEVIDRTVKRWLGEERKAGTDGTYRHPNKRFETLLRESSFRDLETASFRFERSWSTDQIFGYLYSASYSSIPVLGNKKEEFEADLRTRLKANEANGQFMEKAVVDVIMAWKH